MRGPEDDNKRRYIKLILAPPHAHKLPFIPSRLWDELQSVCVRGRNAVPAKERSNVSHLPGRAVPDPGVLWPPRLRL